MASNTSKSAGLGLLHRFPPEVRSQILKEYSANPVATLKMVPSGENYPGTDKPRYDCYIQSSPWEAYAVSKALHDEASPHRQPLELALNNLDFQKYGLNPIRWDIPKPLRNAATRIIVQVDPRTTRKLSALDREVASDYQHGKTLELRMVLPDEEVDQWSKETRFTESFEAEVNRGLHDAAIFQIWKEWLAKSSWSYGFKIDDCNGDHMRGWSCSCERNEVVLDLECWRSSVREVKKKGDKIRALHVVFDLKTETVVDRYVVRRPVGANVWDYFGRFHDRPWRKIEVGPPVYPWDDPTHPLH